MQRKQILKYIDLEPCETKYKSKDLPRGHLRSAHHIKFKLKRLDKPKSPICFQCFLCNCTCRNKLSYHKHLQSCHQMESDPLQESEIQPDLDDPNNFVHLAISPMKRE